MIFSRVDCSFMEYFCNELFFSGITNFGENKKIFFWKDCRFKSFRLNWNVLKAAALVLSKYILKWFQMLLNLWLKFVFRNNKNIEKISTEKIIFICCWFKLLFKFQKLIPAKIPSNHLVFCECYLLFKLDKRSFNNWCSSGAICAKKKLLFVVRLIYRKRIDYHSVKQRECCKIWTGNRMNCCHCSFFGIPYLLCTQCLPFSHFYIPNPSSLSYSFHFKHRVHLAWINTGIRGFCLRCIRPFGLYHLSSVTCQSFATSIETNFRFDERTGVCYTHRWTKKAWFPFKNLAN